MSDERIRYADVGGERIAYAVDGDPNCPSLVLLQRFRGTIDDWDPLFIERLARRYHVHRFDNVGIGRSSGEVPSSIAEMSGIAAAFIEALRLSGSHLLGWSLGGYIAQLVALDRPELIGSLVLAASGPGGVTDGPRPDARVAELALKPVLRSEDLTFLFSGGSETSDAAMSAAARRSAEVASGPTVTLDGATRQRAAIGEWWKGNGAARPRLGDLNMPVLVANGVRDRMIPAYSAYLISQEAPDAKLVLYPDSGHGFLFQHTEAFASEVEDFIA